MQSDTIASQPLETRAVAGFWLTGGRHQWRSDKFSLTTVTELLRSTLSEGAPSIRTSSKSSFGEAGVLSCRAGLGLCCGAPSVRPSSDRPGRGSRLGLGRAGLGLPLGADRSNAKQASYGNAQEATDGKPQKGKRGTGANQVCGDMPSEPSFR